MRGTVLKRHNLIVEIDKVHRLRRQLKARSNSEAVRMAIDRELATSMGLNALKRLRDLRAIEDVFNRAPSKRR